MSNPKKISKLVFTLFLLVNFIIIGFIIFGGNILDKRSILKMVLLIISPFSMAGLIYIHFKYIEPTSFYLGKEELAFLISQKVAMSGERIASTQCGGKISKYHSSSKMIKVIVYPHGIWIKPFLLSPFAIELNQIVNIREETRTFKDVLIIEHRSIIVSSPIELYLDLGDYARESINRLLKT